MKNWCVEILITQKLLKIKKIQKIILNKYKFVIITAIIMLQIMHQLMIKIITIILVMLIIIKLLKNK